jgi:SAM-dependent methyltransferase
MDPELRRAWTQIVTADHYERHMAAIGQAQAAAELMAWMIAKADLPEGASVTVVGAGTGQMFDYLDARILRPYRLTLADLNPDYLAKLRTRLERAGLGAEVVEDDFEQTRLPAEADLVTATLLLEHIEWRRGVDAFASLRPRGCGVVIQENPPEFSSAVTPGRVLPPSLAKAVETAHAILVPRGELVAAMAERGFVLRASEERGVADGKRLAALLFDRAA